MLVYSTEDHRYYSVLREAGYYYMVYTDEACTKTKSIPKSKITKVVNK